MIRFKNRYRKSPMYQYKFALDKVYNDNKNVCNIISFCPELQAETGNKKIS